MPTRGIDTYGKTRAAAAAGAEPKHKQPALVNSASYTRENIYFRLFSYVQICIGIFFYVKCTEPVT